MALQFLSHPHIPGLLLVFVNGHYGGNARRVLKPNPEHEAYAQAVALMTKEEQHAAPRFPSKETFSHYMAEPALGAGNPTLFNFPVEALTSDDALEQYLLKCNHLSSLANFGLSR